MKAVRESPFSVGLCNSGGDIRGLKAAARAEPGVSGRGVCNLLRL